LKSLYQMSQFSPCIQRQRRLTRPEEDFEGGDVELTYGEELDNGSVDDMSGDELEAHREAKKILPNQ
jgi:hypothetical protein